MVGSFVNKVTTPVKEMYFKVIKEMSVQFFAKVKAASPVTSEIERSGEKKQPS